MGVNLDKPHRWKDDIVCSVDLYNKWFLRFAPKTYREERAKAIERVDAMLQRTGHLRQLGLRELKKHPAILFALRMCTAPPIARDRLVGLADIPKSLVDSMERKGRVPPRMASSDLSANLRKVRKTIIRLLDRDLFPWLAESREPRRQEPGRAATIVADRLCGANADPIVRNAQEKRQLNKIKRWLNTRGYKDVTSRKPFSDMSAGDFALRLNVQGLKEDGKVVNIPADVAIMPVQGKSGDLPLVVEAKSAGDFTNTNKRRKEEAAKVGQLRRKHGDRIRYVLFLCGYFDSGYLGYEAAEGIDWVWEHRVDDLARFNL
jgi:hypothetical protein